jgi:SAM-dependent methyltransferase
MGHGIESFEGASYDTVGRYRQDEINGFSKELIDSLLEAALLQDAGMVLDAMAGDGNLTVALHEFCKQRQMEMPRVIALEFSRVQTEFAEHALAPLGARAIWGDVLSMTERRGGRQIPEGSFDRVLIKSSNHEIPLADQPRMYRSVFRVLRPSGSFVNLGFLFDEDGERDELRSIARVKDTLAGMDGAVRNRHFLTRKEFYELLGEAGFVDIHAVCNFDYRIRSQVVAEQYFKPEVRLAGDLEHQAAQVKAFRLRKKGRILFEGASSVMLCPGEITYARKPSMAETNARIFRQYPMDFLRHIRVHAEMLEKAARQVPEHGSVLDLGCGIGLLTEHLPAATTRYVGLDLSTEFVGAASARYSSRPNLSFRVADLTRDDLGEQVDVVTILNTLNLPGLKAVDLLRKAARALRPGGRIVVSGPTSSQSWNAIEDKILRQLDEDGKLKGNESRFQAMADASRRLLVKEGYYCSLEGMVALLKHLGFRRIVEASNDIYHGASYFVVAER